MKKNNRKKKNSVAKERKVQGKLSIHPRGFGFCDVSETLSVFIPGHKIGNAIDQDIVEVVITSDGPKGPDGRVIKVIKRLRDIIVGTICHLLRNGDAIVFTKLLAKNKTLIVKKEKKDFKIGMRVGVKIHSNKNKTDTIKGVIVKQYGLITDAKQDVPAALDAFFIQSEFKKTELKGLEHLKAVDNDKNRRDLTKQNCLTIDPNDAKDFDDAVFAQKTKKGYVLWVHIADVSFFIKTDSSLDKAARARSNSTYFPGKCSPMLPEILSNNLCSLKPGVKRLCVTVEMHFDTNAKLEHYEIYKSTIKSSSRLTYEKAKLILDNKLEHKQKNELKLLSELGSKLKQQRINRGCVDLSSSEVLLILDKDQNIKKTTIVEYDITHQIIEDFMLKANEVVALELKKRASLGIYRVHEPPNKDSLDEFKAFCLNLGMKSCKTSTSNDIKEIFDQAKQLDCLEQVTTRYIKSMKLAIYSESNSGHFGLSLDNYLHFTSPIRRYADLVVHRILFEKNYTPTLKKIAKELSDKERNSFKAESAVKAIKKLRYLEKIFNKNPEHVFEGCISKVSSLGIAFDLPFLMFDGFISNSDLPEESTPMDKRFPLGKTIKVRIKKIDLIYQTCNFLLVNS